MISLRVGRGEEKSSLRKLRESKTKKDVKFFILKERKDLVRERERERNGEGKKDV